MNILYISYDGALDPLGQSQVLPYILKLSEKGFKITLLTYEKKKNIALSRDKIIKLKDSLNKNKVRWEFLNYHKSPNIPATIFDIVSGFIKAMILIHKDEIKVIHCRSFIGAIPGFLLARLFRLKFIYDMRGLWPDEKVDAGSWNKNSLVYRFTKYMENKFIKHADWIIVLTNKGKSILVNSYESCTRISVIPTCVDTELFMEKQDIDPKDHGISAKFIMLYSGSIGSWYMFDEIAAFFNEIDKTFDNTLFLILTNNDPQEVDGLLKDKNISKDKYKIMSLTRSEVADWLKIADVSVFFIKPCFSKQFSCPTKLAESLACGVPVVINSGIGDTDSFVKDNKVGVVIDSFAPEVLKDGVSRLIKLLKDGIVLEKRCRKLAEDEFSLEKGVDTYRRIYNQV